MRCEAEEEAARLAREHELAEAAAAQAALEKRDAQRALLEHAQAHAEMQRRTAATTRQMADARRELLALETQRLEEQAAELSATEDVIDERKAEANQRMASENITREVLGRLKKLPSAQQAAARLAEVDHAPAAARAATDSRRRITALSVIRAEYHCATFGASLGDTGDTGPVFTAFTKYSVSPKQLVGTPLCCS